MGVLCMLFPAAIFCRVRHKVFGIEYGKTADGFLHLLFEYLSGNALINSFVILLRIAVSHKAGNVLEELNTYSGFAVKYLALAVVLACILPYVELTISKNWVFVFHCNMKPCHGILGSRTKICIVGLYAAIMAAHHFIRLFDNCFWGDEGIAINAARMPWGDMLEYVAENGHSPFHYAFAWICVRLFGASGFIYHLSATLPYFITVVLSVTLVRKWFGNKTAILFVTLATLLESAVIYNLEVRMYAWCQVFILAAYLLLYRLFKTGKDIYYLFVAICSLGAAYSHYFALANVGFIYLGLLAYMIKVKPRDIGKTILSGGSVLALLFPWLILQKRLKA